MRHFSNIEFGNIEKHVKIGWSFFKFLHYTFNKQLHLHFSVKKSNIETTSKRNSSIQIIPQEASLISRLLAVGNVGTRTLKHEVTSCIKTEMRLKAVFMHTRARTRTRRNMTAEIYWIPFSLKTHNRASRATLVPFVSASDLNHDVGFISRIDAQEERSDFLEYILDGRQSPYTQRTLP